MKDTCRGGPCEWEGKLSQRYGVPTHKSMWPCPFFGATQVERQQINRPMTSEVRGRIWPPYIGTLPATVALGDLKAGFLLPCTWHAASRWRMRVGQVLAGNTDYNVLILVIGVVVIKPQNTCLCQRLKRRTYSVGRWSCDVDFPP